jgi:hypothetical protein
MPDFLSRRKFIGTAALTLSSAAIGAKDGTRLSRHVEISDKIWAEKKKKYKPKGMRLGSDTDKLNAVKGKGPFAILDYLKAHNFDGAFFRTMLDISPTLDSGQLKEVKAHADSLGLFLDGGIGWLNPYNTAETPEVRRFGNGDYRLAVEKMIKAARLIDCIELYAVSGHSVHGNPFFVAYDRFRTDVSWGD